eukprot:TRINITY_DN4153_c0_g1_i7.p1 TRINITY_DN4153_c0_g1~~TRINITY_DN4153_c0_g1_i7.p1  ORF type:complete len:500 (-),score=66.77 TRINITY_DN4153_c0_g1_i7:60-1559(-)
MIHTQKQALLRNQYGRPNGRDVRTAQSKRFASLEPKDHPQLVKKNAHPPPHTHLKPLNQSRHYTRQTTGASAVSNISHHELNVLLLKSPNAPKSKKMEDTIVVKASPNTSVTLTSKRSRTPTISHNKRDSELTKKIITSPIVNQLKYKEGRSGGSSTKTSTTERNEFKIRKEGVNHSFSFAGSKAQKAEKRPVSGPKSQLPILQPVMDLESVADPSHLNSIRESVKSSGSNMNPVDDQTTVSGSMRASYTANQLITPTSISEQHEHDGKEDDVIEVNASKEDANIGDQITNGEGIKEISVNNSTASFRQISVRSQRRESGQSNAPSLPKGQSSTVEENASMRMSVEQKLLSEHGAKDEESYANDFMEEEEEDEKEKEEEEEESKGEPMSNTRDLDDALGEEVKENEEIDKRLAAESYRLNQVESAASMVRVRNDANDDADRYEPDYESDHHDQNQLDNAENETVCETHASRGHETHQTTAQATNDSDSTHSHRLSLIHI